MSGETEGTNGTGTGDGQENGTGTDTGTGTESTNVDHEAEAKKWQALSRKHEAESKKAQDALDKIRKANETEQEKVVNAAKEEGRASAIAEVSARLLSAEIRVAASGKLADPEDAAALLGDHPEFVDKDGNVDSKAVAAAIDALVKAKPYLAANAAGSKARPLPGGGKDGASGFSLNDAIRQKAGRG